MHKAQAAQALRVMNDEVETLEKIHNKVKLHWF
jgi:hypothetical protein